MKQGKRNSALEPYRVLDLTDEKGFLCGKILADLGADVIKIEKPGGNSGRNIGPFNKDIPGLERSLYWLAYNSNKRSITLNIETSDGKQIFSQLVKEAGFVIESFPIGYMEKLGLGFHDLNQLNRNVILISITPFGQTGPHKDYLASDIVSAAMGGGMFLTGDTDRPPVRIGVPQAELHASTQAAAAAMIAHYHRQKTGRGQHVDVSIQQSLIMTTFNALAFWALHHEVVGRGGQYRTGLSTSVRLRQTWPCKDGYVSYILIGGVLGAKDNRLLSKWMDDEEMGDELFRKFEWENLSIRDMTIELQQKLEEPLLNFFINHTKLELYEGAAKRGIKLYPVYTPQELLENPQLQARDFWIKMEYPELSDNITFPGDFIKLSETPLRSNRRAPRIGEHNLEVYGELGLTAREIVMLKEGKII